MEAITLTPRVEGELIVLELSRFACRVGLTLEAWETLRQECDRAAEGIVLAAEEKED